MICPILITHTIAINTASEQYTLNYKATFHTSKLIYKLTSTFCYTFYGGSL